MNVCKPFLYCILDNYAADLWRHLSLYKSKKLYIIETRVRNKIINV